MIHLHCHTSYSVGDAIGTPEQLIRAAAEGGFTALGISEHGNLSSVPRFIKAAADAGIKPILGMEAYLYDGDLNKQYDKAADKREAHYANILHLLLIAQDDVGFRTLVHLNNIGHDPTNFYYKPRIDWRHLQQHNKGLLVTTGCASGPIGQSIVKYDSLDRAWDRMGKLHSIFGSDRLYAEVQPTDFSEQARINSHAVAYTNDFDISLVATCDVHYPAADDARFRDYLIAINRHTTLDKIAELNNPQSLWLQSEGQVHKGLTNMGMANKDATNAIGGALDIAGRIGDYNLHSDTPNLPPLAGILDPAKTMRGLCLKQMQRKELLTTVYIKRFEYEYKLIADKEFAAYFLVVADFVGWARTNDILIGPGRGSATGSLIAYLLGITLIDPVEHKLLFQRFLNEDRTDLPDIDIDVQKDKRDQVIEYVRAKYGAIYGIGTYSNFHVKGTVRDMIRILGLDIKAPSDLKDETVMDLAEACDRSPELVAIGKAHPEVFAGIEALSGNVRQYGKHAGGFTYTDKDTLLPLLNVGGEMLSAWVEGVDYRDLADLGLIKFDILGITALSVLSECKRLTGVALTSIPLDDAAVLAQFAAGWTDTTFQFNSWSAKRYLKELKPTSFNDIVAANALLRPGAIDMGMHKEYVRRKNNPDDRSWAVHPVMTDVLDDTFGIIVYQEQLTELAAKLGLVSLSDGEKLRKEIVKYGKSTVHKQDLDEVKHRLMLGFAINGLDEDESEQIWENFLAFSRYGFTKNHSFPYSSIAYWQQWFRVHHPLQFFYSYLKYEDSDENIEKGILDAATFGIDILLPCVNRSDVSFSIDGQAIRFGLVNIPYVGQAAAEEIIKHRPYDSIGDFKERVPKRKVNKRAIEHLQADGAFMSLDTDKHEDLLR